MYCPQCRTEYREGFTVCADCDEPLVSDLPPEPVRGATPDLVVVYEAPIHEAEVMRSVLEGSGIAAALKSGQSAAYPVTVGDLGLAHIWVLKSDSARAREVIDAALRGDLDLQDDPQT